MAKRTKSAVATIRPKPAEAAKKTPLDPIDLYERICLMAGAMTAAAWRFENLGQFGDAAKLRDCLGRWGPAPGDKRPQPSAGNGHSTH